MNNFFSYALDGGRSYYPTDLFESKLYQVRKADPKGYERIRKTIDRLLIDPSVSDGKMKGLYHAVSRNMWAAGTTDSFITGVKDALRRTGGFTAAPSPTTVSFF